MTLPPASPPLAASPQQFAAIATTISYVGIALIAVLIPLNVTVACCILRRRRAPPTTALRKMPYTVSISPKRCSPSGEEKRRLTNDEQPDAAEVITPQATIPISSRDGALSSRTVSAILQDMPAESVDASVGATAKSLRKIILPCSNETCTGRLRFNLEHFQGGKVLLATCPSCGHECEYAVPSADQEALADGDDIEDDVEALEELYLTRKLQSRLTNKLEGVPSPSRGGRPGAPGTPGSRERARERIERVRLSRQQSSTSDGDEAGAGSPWASPAPAVAMSVARAMSPSPSSRRSSASETPDGCTPALLASRSHEDEPQTTVQVPGVPSAVRKKAQLGV